MLAEPLRSRGYATLEVVCEQTRGQLAREQLWPRGRIQENLDVLERALSERGLALLTTEELLARIHERAVARGQVVALPSRRCGAAPPVEEEDPFSRWTGKSLGLDAQYAHLPFFQGAAHGQ